MFRKFLEKLFYLFVFLLPWQTVWIIREIFYDGEKWQYGTIGLYLSDVALWVWLFGVAVLYWQKIKKYLIENKKIFFILFAFVSWSLASLLWSGDRELSLYFSVLLFSGAGLFLMIPIFSFSKQKVVKIFTISVVLQSVIGLMQFIIQQTISQKFLGLSHREIWQGGNAVFTVNGERWLRDYGAMPHPNIFGALLFTTLLLIIGLYFFSAFRKNISVKTIYFIGIALVSANILFTFSRSAWLMTMMGTMVILVLFWRGKEKILMPIFVAIALAVVIIFSSANLFKERVERDSLPTHNSIADRELYIRQALKSISQYPLIGVGIGDYTKSVFEQDHRLRPIWFYQPVHNIFILITAELGIVGLVLFLLFLILIYNHIIRSWYHFNFWQKIFSVIFSLLLAFSLLDHWLWSTHFGLLFLFFLAGLIFKK